MTYTTTGVQSGKTDALAGDLSCKYNVSGATFTTKLFTSGKLTQEVVLEKAGVKGLKLTLLGGIGPKQTLTAIGEYVHPHVSAVAAFNCLGSPAVLASTTVGSKAFTMGAQGEIDIDSKELKKVDAVFNYSSDKEHEATCMIQDKGQKAKFSYSHIVSKTFSVAADIAYEKASEKVVLTMGSKHEIDDDTTLKTKIDTAGSISLSYIQEIRKNTTLTLCSKFDVLNLDAPSHKFGLSLVIE